MEGVWCPCLVFRLAVPPLVEANMDILAVVTIVIAGFVQKHLLHCWGVLFHFISVAVPRWAVEGGGLSAFSSQALFLCPTLRVPPRRLPLCPRSKRGQSFRGNKSFHLESGSSILNSGKELRVAFPPVTLLFHLIFVLSSTQDFDASVRSHSSFSFIRVFPVLLGCFSSSFLLIASNCISAETAAVSPTCNLPHLPT